MIRSTRSYKTALLTPLFFMQGCISDNANAKSPIGDNVHYNVYPIFLDGLKNHVNRKRSDLYKIIEDEYELSAKKEIYKPYAASIEENSLSHMLTTFCEAKKIQSIAIYAKNGEAIALSRHKGITDNWYLEDKFWGKGQSTYQIDIRWSLKGKKTTRLCTIYESGNFKPTNNEKIIGYVRWVE